MNALAVSVASGMDVVSHGIIRVSITVDKEYMMQISTYRLPQDVPVHFCMNKTAVIIDVLRATTTIVTALRNGARNVIPVAEVEEAVELSRNFSPEDQVLAGERMCVQIDGFDLSNSPLEFTEERVRDKAVFLTTTNGTRAIQGTQAAEVLIGALVNATATGQYLAKQGRDAVLICAGTLGHFSMEDHLAAGAIIHAIKDIDPSAETDDFSLASLILYQHCSTEEKMHQLLDQTQHYRRLKGLGLIGDLDHCLCQDSMPILAGYEDGSVSLIK